MAEIRWDVWILGCESLLGVARPWMAADPWNSPYWNIGDSFALGNTISLTSPADGGVTFFEA